MEHQVCLIQATYLLIPLSNEAEAIDTLNDNAFVTIIHVDVGVAGHW